MNTSSGTLTVEAVPMPNDSPTWKPLQQLKNKPAMSIKEIEET